MIVIYENSLLNKIIVTFHEDIKRISDDRVIPINFLDKTTLFDTLDKWKVEDILLFVSSNIYEDDFFATVPENVRLIVKDDKRYENWYVYSIGAKTGVKNKELLDVLFRDNTSPTIGQRRITYAILNYINEPRRVFSDIFDKATNILEREGKEIIDSQKENINLSKTQSIYRIINNNKYCITLTDFQETLWQLDESNVFDFIIIAKIFLKLGKVRLSILNKCKNKHIFSDRVIYVNGCLEFSSISVSEFIDVCYN